MIESCIENNDVLSRKNLMKNLNKLHVKKTKIIHFDIKNNDDDKIVFYASGQVGNYRIFITIIESLRWRWEFKVNRNSN